MSQDWNNNTYLSSDQITVNMQDIEDNFACLKSMFSGTSAPSDPVAGMTWFYTTNKIPKIRNNANDAWLGIMQGDASHKIWVYRNTAPDGWVVDSAVTDVILAIKGGAQAYNVSGGGLAGSWTWPSFTLSAAELPPHTHGAAANHQHALRQQKWGSSGGANVCLAITAVDGSGYEDLYTYVWPDGGHTHTSVGGGDPHTHGGIYFRPYAAVGTLQYLNL